MGLSQKTTDLNSIKQKVHFKILSHTFVAHFYYVLFICCVEKEVFQKYTSFKLRILNPAFPISSFFRCVPFFIVDVVGLIPCFSAFSAGLVHDHASPLFYYFLFPVSSWAGDQVDSPFFLRNAIHFYTFSPLSRSAATALGAAARAAKQTTCICMASVVFSPHTKSLSCNVTKSRNAQYNQFS